MKSNNLYEDKTEQTRVNHEIVNEIIKAAQSMFNLSTPKFSEDSTLYYSFDYNNLNQWLCIEIDEAGVTTIHCQDDTRARWGEQILNAGESFIKFNDKVLWVFAS